MMDVKVDTTQNVWDDYYDYLNDTNLNLQTIDLDIIDAEGISEILLKLENKANASQCLQGAPLDDASKQTHGRIENPSKKN
jgi:hypothetical protein